MSANGRNYQYPPAHASGRSRWQWIVGAIIAALLSGYFGVDWIVQPADPGAATTTTANAE